jgi:hypothetical protein
MKITSRPVGRISVSALLLASFAVSGCTAAKPPPKSSPGDFTGVERVIEQMLAEERRALRARTVLSDDQIPPVAMPEVKSDDVFPKFAPDEADSSDTFAQDVLRIQEVVPTWDNGTGIALKFLRESSGQRVSLVYVDPTAPVREQGGDHWVIAATAKTEKRTLGHFVLLLRDLSPGHYHGSASDDSVVMSTSMTSDWDPTDPDTTWSKNNESWCEIVLRQGHDPSTLEGQFRAKLIDNQGTGFHNIESGYVYIKQ